MSKGAQQETLKSFILKVLNGTTIAIVVALIPNAILATFLKPFPDVQFAVEFLHIVQVFQSFVPIMAGFLIANQFKLNPMQMVSVGGATYLGSGAWRYVPEAKIEATTSAIFQLSGIGDVINIMITAALAILLVKYIGDKFGSLTIILMPIVVGTGMGYLGWKILPYVSKITTMIGVFINTFTSFQPIIMCMFIAVAFALIIVSPISSIAIGLAIGLTGTSAAAAGMGVATTTAFLVWATARVNNAGVPIAIGLGAMKMMMTNFLTNPIMIIPLAICAAISSLSVPLLRMVGTPSTAGFGLIGMVSPLEAFNSSSVSLILIVITWLIIPFVIGYIVNRVCCDILKLYDKEIFVFKEQ